MLLAWMLCKWNAGRLSVWLPRNCFRNLITSNIFQFMQNSLLILFFWRVCSFPFAFESQVVNLHFEYRITNLHLYILNHKEVSFMCRALRTWNRMTLQHMDARVWHGDGAQEARVPIVTPSLQLPILYSICSQPDLRSSWRTQGQGNPVCSSEIIQVPALPSLHLNPSSNCSFPVWRAGTGSANFLLSGNNVMAWESYAWSHLL